MATVIDRRQSMTRRWCASLLGENLSERTFDFATIAEACSGKSVLPLDDEPAHQRVIAAIESALTETIARTERGDSPVRKLRRINEASRFFEDGILARLDAMPGLRCEVPPTRCGSPPAIRLSGSAHHRRGIRRWCFISIPNSSSTDRRRARCRTFYFEPKNETLKITDDAVHLLAGIEHDGKEQQWTFTGWRLVDLSTLRVRLKAEFQASNADLYRKSGLSLPESDPLASRLP